MIISHRHRYLFVQLNQTGSTAIARELRKYYDGSPILHKHARYRDFLRVASDPEKAYFAFSCIRNPLDRVVSRYHKYKSDHIGRSSKWSELGLRLYRHLVVRRTYALVKRSDVDFALYFRSCYRLPYDDWSSLSHRELEYVIRFEHLQEGFAEVLELLGLEQVRPLPRWNATADKSQDYLSCYSAEIIGRAKWVFAPFMREWGYELPAEWGDDGVHWSSQAVYRLLSWPRKLYWRHLVQGLVPRVR